MHFFQFKRAKESKDLFDFFKKIQRFYVPLKIYQKLISFIKQ